MLLRDPYYPYYWVSLGRNLTVFLYPCCNLHPGKLLQPIVVIVVATTITAQLLKPGSNTQWGETLTLAYTMYAKSWSVLKVEQEASESSTRTKSLSDRQADLAIQQLTTYASARTEIPDFEANQSSWFTMIRIVRH